MAGQEYNNLGGGGPLIDLEHIKMFAVEWPSVLSKCMATTVAFACLIGQLRTLPCCILKFLA